MVWRQLVRSMAAGTRRAELAVQRRHRNSEKAKQQHEREIARFARRKARLQAAEQAADDVQRFELYLRAIVELHKDCIEEWDWQDIIYSPQPPAPILTTDKENAARAKLDTFKPGLLTRAFGNATRKVAELTQAVETARSADAREHGEILKRYQELVTTWDIERRIAKLVIAKDPSGFQEALAYVDALGDVNDFGSRASVTRVQPDQMVLRYAIVDRETIPSEEPKLSSPGRILSTTMSADRYWAVFHDHVCSAALRIARDVFNILPVQHVIVNVSRNYENSMSGHRVSENILAVRFWRRVLNQIDLQAIVPADIVKKFQHRMKFQKAVGFEQVEPFAADDQPPSPLPND